MDTIAVFNQKGGVGKTSVAFHLGWYLAGRGKRVLLVDLDPQGNLSSLFDVNACQAGEIFTNNSGEGIHPAEVTREAPSGPHTFSILSANERLQALEATTNGIQGLTRLRKALRAEEGRWDAVVVDCPPSLGGFSANAIVAADWVLIPCTVRQFSIHGLEHVTEVIQATKEEGLNPDIKVLGIVLNQFKADSKRKTLFERDISKGVAERYGEDLLPASIPTSIKIEEALYCKLPIWEYIKAAKDRSADVAAKAYLGVMNEIGRRMNRVGISAAEVSNELAG